MKKFDLYQDSPTGVPILKINNVRIKAIVSIEYKWQTKSNSSMGVCKVFVEYWDGEVLKSVGFEKLSEEMSEFK